jgi:uncharacterized membrane protein YczE
MQNEMKSLRRVKGFLTPHKTIPITPWTATSYWKLTPMRFLVLTIGLALFGIGDGLIIQAGLGNAPWSVLAQGLALSFEISIGMATFIVGSIVLLLWIPLKRRVGFATLYNILLISLFIDLAIHFAPPLDFYPARWGYLLFGIALVGIGSALYLTCGLGAGPRDGLMTGLHERTGVRVGRIRMALELSVLLIGWLLGGTVGIGTAVFALLIGQSIAISLGVVARATSK